MDVKKLKPLLIRDLPFPTFLVEIFSQKVLKWQVVFKKRLRLFHENFDDSVMSIVAKKSCL